MKVSYKRDFHHSYIILQDDSITKLESYEVRILLRSRVPGLLSCQVQNIDNQALFYYEVTSMQPLSSLYENKKFRSEDLHMLIDAILKVMDAMSSYLLDPDMLLLNPDYIYINLGEQQAKFCFWPFPSEESGHLLSFMEYLLPLIDHQDPEAVVLGYQLYRVSMDGSASPDIMRQLLQNRQTPEKVTEISAEDEFLKEDDFHSSKLIEHELRQREELLADLLSNPEAEKNTKTPPVVFLIVGISFLIVFYFYLLKNHFFHTNLQAGSGAACILAMSIAIAVGFGVRHKWNNKNTGTDDTGDHILISEKDDEPSKNLRREDMDELPDISEARETTFLSLSQDGRRRLVALEPDTEDIILKSGVNIVGTLENAVDVVLYSPVVSRIHAKIINEEDCRIIDMNSKNGTFVNKTAAEGNEGLPLINGDLITFANLTFRFEDH